ncbi:MAG: DUF5615 family PIN-like protein [Thermostichus sp. BF3_bins_97]
MRTLVACASRHGATSEIATRVAAALQELGHTVTDLRGSSWQGIPDEEVWQLAQEQQALLITTDKGFLQNREMTHCGLLIIRLRQPNQQKIHTRILGSLNHFSEEDWPNQVVVIRDVAQSVWRR